MVLPVLIYGCESWTIKESWVPKNWCFWTMLLEKTVESPLDCKEIQPVGPKGNQSWTFIGRTDAKADAPVLLVKELTHLKRPWCWGRVKAEGDNRGWDGWMESPTWMDMSLSKLRELVMDRKAFVCCSPWGRKELDTTEQLNRTDRWVSITNKLNITNIWTYILHATLVICLSHYRNDVHVLSCS